MYHVTKTKNVKNIWNNGLKYNPPNEKWVNKRREMRKLIDNIGNNIHNNWINRENSIFFWTTYEEAMRYAQKRVYDSAIVEMNPYSGNLWCVENTEVENFYDRFINKSDNTSKEEFNDTATKLVRNAREWNGERCDGLEVWTQPPVSNEYIHQIINTDGHPYDID